jgi:outer membrane protein assembly factor BamB
LAIVTVAVGALGPIIGAAPATAAVVASSQWPQFGQSERHLNTNPDERTFNPGNVAGLQTRFTAHFGDNNATEGGPVVANGILYIADFDGNLSAFAAKGCGVGSCEPLWRGHADNDFATTPAVAGGLVLVGSADRFLYAFPAAGCGAAVCQPQWRGQLADGALDSSVAVAGNTVYIADAGGHLYAFALQGCGSAVCKPLWVGQGLSNESLGAPAVGNGFVYVSSFLSTPDLFTGRMLVFSAAGCGKATCNPVWTADIGGPAGRAAAPTVTADTVFVGSTTLFGDGTNTDFHLFAFPAIGCGAKTCKPLRSYDTGDGGVSGAPAVAGNVLFAATQDFTDDGIGVVSAYPAAGCGKPQCAPLWTGENFAMGFESAPSVVGGVVFVGKGPASGFPVDAGLYGFNAAGCGATFCAPISFLQLGTEQNFMGSPLAVAGGKIFMVSTDNTTGHSNVYAIGLPG